MHYRGWIGRLLLIAVLLGAAGRASATETRRTGRITGLVVSGPNTSLQYFVFKLDTSVEQGCNFTGRYAISLATPTGKAQLATVMLAYATGQTVLVVGKGTAVAGPSTPTECDIDGCSETAVFVCLGGINC